MEDEEEEQGGGDAGGHWELWLGTADWELWEGIWALAELGPLLCIPIPFSVKNSSRSMYCSWNKPPSHGRVLSQSSGPKKADWELGRIGPEPGVPPTPPGPPPLTPEESSSESRGLSLSFISQQSLGLLWSALIGSCSKDFKLVIEVKCPLWGPVPAGLLAPNCGLVAPAGRSGGRSWVRGLDITSREEEKGGGAGVGRAEWNNLQSVSSRSK